MSENVLTQINYLQGKRFILVKLDEQDRFLVVPSHCSDLIVPTRELSNYITQHNDAADSTQDTNDAANSTQDTNDDAANSTNNRWPRHA